MHKFISKIIFQCIVLALLLFAFVPGAHAIIRCPNVYAFGDRLCYDTALDTLQLYIGNVPRFEVSNGKIDLSGMTAAEHDILLWRNDDPQHPSYGDHIIRTTGNSDMEFRAPDGQGGSTMIWRVISEPTEPWVFMNFQDAAMAIGKDGNSWNFSGPEKRYLAMYDDTRHFAFNQDGSQNADLVLWSNMQQPSPVGELGIRASGGNSVQLYVPDGSGGGMNVLQVSNGLLDLSGMVGDYTGIKLGEKQEILRDVPHDTILFITGDNLGTTLNTLSVGPYGAHWRSRESGGSDYMFAEIRPSEQGGFFTSIGKNGNSGEFQYNEDTRKIYLTENNAGSNTLMTLSVDLLEASGVIKTTPRGSATCDPSTEGSIYYDNDDPVRHFWGCTDSGWKQLDNL